MYLRLFIALIFFTFIIKKFFLKLKIKQSIYLYLESIKRIKYLQKNNHDSQVILNKISSSGFILLIKLGSFLMPYTIIFYLLQKDFKMNFLIVTLIPILPYLIILKKRAK